MEQRREARERRQAAAKIAFGMMAMVCLAAGLIIYLFAETLGLSKDTAEIVAIAFLVAGAADYAVLKLWDRVVARRRQ